MGTADSGSAQGRSERWIPEWDGASYARNTAHHRLHDDRFLAPLALRGDERVLDVGCGSGDFTAKVAALVPEGSVVGIDAQASMLDQARLVARGNQSFELVAAQDVAAAFPAEAFDVVISRATLHWVPAEDQADVLAGMFTVLRPGGQLRIECGGAGNVATIQAFLDDISRSVGGPVDPWCFSDAGWYLDRLEAAGFGVADNDVITTAQRRPFDREGLIGWIDSQAAMAYEIDMDTEQRATFRARIAERLDEMRRPDGTYDLTYARLEASARRPG